MNRAPASILVSFALSSDIAGSFETFPSQAGKSPNLDSGFGSVISTFAFMMDVLLFVLHSPGTYLEKARNLAAQALKKIVAARIRLPVSIWP